MAEIPLNEVLYSDGAIDSLSRRQIRALLRTIRAQSDYLNSALDNAERFMRFGQRPAYIVDYDLLHRYMFEFDENPDWEQELFYLFSDESTQFIIGPGTQEELARSTDKRYISRHEAPAFEFGLTRLTELLTASNFVLFADVSDSIDAEELTQEYDVIKKELDRSRREASDAANRADALNCAAVICLRRSATSPTAHYPSLLTGTNVLLDELFLTSNLRAGIARSPDEAIYVQVLFRLFPDAGEALRHAQDMRVALAEIEAELCKSPAFRNPALTAQQLDWEQTLERERVGRRLRRQVEVLTKFVEDPVVFESQRIYENAHLAVASLVQQRGEFEVTVDESPRRLLDLIADVHAVIKESDRAKSRGLAGLWKTVLEITPTPCEGFTTYEVSDRGPRRVIRTPYLVIEHHPAVKGRTHEHFVIRWASSRDAHRIVDALSDAFITYEVPEVELVVATLSEVWDWTGVVPITLDELREAAAEASRACREHPSDRSEVVWVRMNAKRFDLYADITVRDTRDPLIGVFGHKLEGGCVANLYDKTAARYVFTVWLSEALHSVLAAAS
jgi:hypothetical protein